MVKKSAVMLRSYVISLLRSFIRNKQSTVNNIFGLSVGLCSALLIALYAIDEIRYDRFQKDPAHIYRFNTQYGPQNEAVPVGPYLLNEHLSENIPEISSGVRIRPENEDDIWFRYSDRNYTRQDFQTEAETDPDCFSVLLCNIPDHPEPVRQQPDQLYDGRGLWVQGIRVICNP